MNPTISAIGAAFPAHTLLQSAAADHASLRCCSTRRHARVLATAYRRSGVTQRRTVVIDPADAPDAFFPPPAHAADAGPTTRERMERFAREAPPVAADAARTALARADRAPGDVTHLVTVSCTGMSAPGVDVELMRMLDLAAGVERTNIGFMGCHGAMNGLRVAAAIVRGDPRAVVLVDCFELCSLHFAYGWDSERIITNALFADGAAAAIVTGDDTPAIWRLAAQGSTVLPGTEDLMTWTVGNHGFDMTLSPRVPQILEAHLPAWLDPWLDGFDLRASDINAWAVHPGGPRILDHIERALDLDADALDVSRSVLDRNGNVSSATLLIIADELAQRGRTGPCVALAFGPGLTIEAALLR